MTQLPDDAAAESVAAVVGDAAYEQEPGLAAERTELAWGRTSLALFACGAAVVKGLPKVTGGPEHPAVGVALLALGGLVWLSGLPYARIQAHATRIGGRRPATARQLAPMAVGAAMVGVAAFFIATFFSG